MGKWCSVFQGRGSDLLELAIIELNSRLSFDLRLTCRLIHLLFTYVFSLYHFISIS